MSFTSLNDYLRPPPNSKLNSLVLCIFFRQLATLFNAGINLLHCCEILEKTANQTTLKTLLQEIQYELLLGKSFSTICAGYPEVFDALTCQLLKIGETTGKLELIFNILANRIEKHFLYKKKIQQILFYPLTICSMMIIICAGIIFFVLPKFQALFQDHLDELPVFTLFIFKISVLLNNSFFVYGVIFCLAAIILAYWYTGYHFRRNIFSLLLHIPLLKNTLHKFLYLQFSKNLAIGVGSGLAIIEAIKIAIPVQSQTFKNHMLKMSNHLQTGITFYEALTYAPFAPEILRQMIRIGEASGTLDLMLHKTADLLEFEIDQSLTQLSLLLEPLIMLMLGVLIGGVVLGLYLPIFKMGTLL